MQHRPDIIFACLPLRDSLAGETLHRGDGGFAGMAGTAHRLDFIGALDRAGLFGNFLAFHDLESLRFEGAQPVQHDLVDREPFVAGRVFGQKRAHLVGKGVGGHINLVAPVKVKQIRARALFAHQRVEGAQEGRILVVPDHHIAIGAEQYRAKRVVGVPKLHVGAVGGIADVEGVKHQHSGIIARHDRGGQPLPAKPPHRLKVGKREPRRFPFAIGKLCRANFDPVGIIGGVVAQGGATRRVNLAGVAEMGVHRPLLQGQDWEDHPHSARRIAT